MRTPAEFTTTTLIGGVSIILPVYPAALLFAWARRFGHIPCSIHSVGAIFTGTHAITSQVRPNLVERRETSSYRA